MTMHSQIQVETPIPVRWVSKEQETALNFETAALLRMTLMPVFTHSKGWGELMSALDRKGFSLAIRKGRMVIQDKATREKICTGQFLGAPLKQLAQRFGRPQIKPVAGQVACGEFVH